MKSYKELILIFMGRSALGTQCRMPSGRAGKSGAAVRETEKSGQFLSDTGEMSDDAGLSFIFVFRHPEDKRIFRMHWKSICMTDIFVKNPLERDADFFILQK